MSLQEEARPVEVRCLLIDGRLIKAERTFISINPARGEPVGSTADATTSDAVAAVAAARRAFGGETWSTDVGLRVRCLNKLYGALVEHKEVLRELTIAEVGASWDPRATARQPHRDRSLRRGPARGVPRVQDHRGGDVRDRRHLDSLATFQSVRAEPA